MYDLKDAILMVASDRISTYDVVHPTPIPDKGKVLTGLSVFWFRRTVDIVPKPLRLVDRRRARRGARASAKFAGSRCCRWNASSAGTSAARGGRTSQRDGAVCRIRPRSVRLVPPRAASTADDAFPAASISSGER